MGVPKFFRYTSERYPCLNELVKQHQIPEFDNMYLDMNGIIHNCSHPDDSDPHFRITEEKIFLDIFHYLDILFQIIKPKKLFFMAIDGVAPRAKMNQQRGRRFRSAKEAEKLEEQAKAKGEVLPTEKRFDSNCITPGTVFMARLHEQLKYFIKQKISQDPLWSKVKVILSGHETPGEGEHKIMDYIRWSRCQPDYDPNTRHCLYGLDADLIMLGVCTHEPHFALLREEVKFGKNTKRAATPEETNFYLLHLPLLKEYLEQEFIEIKDKLPFKFDIEKILDDWVLMGFLVGNDFIPNLPNMHISNDMLPHLYKTYMNVLPTLEGYINEAGILNLERFEAFMQELAKIDMEKFSDVYADLKYFEGKTGRRPNANERREYKPNNDDTFNVNINDIKANKPDDELQALINATQEMFMEDVVEDDDDDEYEDIDSSDEEATMEMEFILHKKDYYMNKLDYSKVTDEVLSDQATCYVRAIQWNLHYYYRGCASWCWYYPHHYAPYISDIKGFKDLKIEFELGEPFKPFEQLLAVLPAASKSLLPTPFHDLMTDEDSPIVHYYPCHFETDLNGKKNDWEAVVLIPFIDEANLLSAMTPCYQRLTDEELKRNSHGPMLIYQWTPDNLGPAPAPDYFPTVAQCHAHERALWRRELEVPASRLACGLLPRADPALLYPGFPTMRHLQYKSSIRKCKVKVFDQPSRNDSMIIEIMPTDDTLWSLEKVAQEYLGKVVWVSWPHLTRARVISVSNEKTRLHHIEREMEVDAPKYSTEHNAGNLHKQWIAERSTIIEHNMSRLGIDLGQVDVIIHACTLTGYKYAVSDGAMVVREQWSARACGYAAQAVVRHVRAAPRPPPRFTSPADAYPPGAVCFLLTKSDYYGCKATVVSTEAIRTGRVKVRVCERPEPTTRAPPADSGVAYKTANHAAAACGISAHMLSRLTGCVFVVLGERNDLPTETQNKINVGLNLKFNKKNQEVSGFTRRCNVTGAWLYSARCVALLQAYARAHPTLFDRLASSHGNDVFFESDIWPGQVGENKPQEVAKWLKAQAHVGAAKRECGSDVYEPEEMKVILEDVKMQLERQQGAESTVTLHVKWNLLYMAELEEGESPADPAADFALLDRVVVVRAGPDAGARGTIVGVVRGAAPAAVRLADKLHAPHTYHVMLDDQPVTDDPAFLRLSSSSLLNITWGRGLHRAVAQPAFAITNQLRSRPDARSAFAAYSPPREILSRPIERNNDTAAQHTAYKAPKQEQATNLLKNLLKISSDGPTENNRQNHKAADQSSWRIKESTRQASPDKFPPQQNWRKENHYKKPPPAPSNEFINSSYNNQPPLPPYPTFGQPFTVPGPSQIPLPQFQTFQQRNQFGYSANQENRARSQEQPRQESRGFPQHLPPVGGVMLPSWVGNQSQSAASAAAKPAAGGAPDKTNNPFVPLQVQTSRRRVRNGPTKQKGMEDVKVPTPILPTPTVAQPAAPPVPSQQQKNSQKPRKRKPRIAANLPFQIE